MKFSAAKTALFFTLIFTASFFGAKVACADGSVASLDLGRMMIFQPDDTINDSYVDSARAQGSMRIENDARGRIRAMEFEAWWRGDTQPVLDDWVIVLDYHPTGARYEVMSLWDNTQYYIRFLRRAPIEHAYDGAVIIIFEQEDGSQVIADYRYR